MASSKKYYVTLVLDKLYLEKYFNPIATGDRVKRGKPNSECFL